MINIISFVDMMISDHQHNKFSNTVYTVATYNETCVHYSYLPSDTANCIVATYIIILMVSLCSNPVVCSYTVTLCTLQYIHTTQLQLYSVSVYIIVIQCISQIVTLYMCAALYIIQVLTLCTRQYIQLHSVLCMAIYYSELHSISHIVSLFTYTA